MDFRGSEITSDSSRMRKRNRFQNKAHKDLSSDLRRMLNQDDLRRMLNQDDYCDVVFVCKDKVRVKAFRSLLVCRCNVLKGMLTNGMKETSLSEINLPGVSSQTLLCVFEFLYTGTIVNVDSINHELLWDVVKAAQFFLLPNLVDIVVDLMLDKIANDLPQVAAMLTVTVECSQSCQADECDPINRELVQILSSNWTHSGYAANLSEEALHYLLSHTKVGDNYAQVDDKATNNVEGKRPIYKKKWEPSLTEYYRFRQIVLWWAYRSVPEWCGKVEEMVDFAVPLIRDTSSLDFDVSIDDRTISTESFSHLKSFLNTSTDIAVRMMSTIDLRYVHLILIEKVVEPLTYFPPSEIMRVFQFHALKTVRSVLGRSVGFSNASCDWKYGTSLTITGGGATIQNRGPKLVAAVALRRMSSKTKTHSWRFVIHEAVNIIVEMGFIFLNADQVSGLGESDLDNNNLQWLIADANGLLVQFANGYSLTVSTRNLESCKTEYEDIIGCFREGLEVSFQLDFVEHNCSLNVNGIDFGICWEHLPERDCYPAISFRRVRHRPEPYSGLVGIQTATMATM